MIKKLKRILNKLICIHEYERFDKTKDKATADELVILQCKKCKKIKFAGGYNLQKIKL